MKKTVLPLTRRARSPETTAWIARDPVLASFLAGLKPHRKKIGQLILFGSRARGDHTARSDYDLLIVVERRDPALSDFLYGLVLDVLLDQGHLVSLKILNRAEHRRLCRLHTPFMEQIESQGVPLV